jgi:hypothetical protein
MLVNDPHSSLVLARDHMRGLRAAAAAERLGGTRRIRRGIADALRRAADRLEAACRAPRPAHQ